MINLKHFQMLLEFMNCTSTAFSFRLPTLWSLVSCAPSRHSQTERVVISNLKQEANSSKYKPLLLLSRARQCGTALVIGLTCGTKTLCVTLLWLLKLHSTRCGWFTQKGEGHAAAMATFSLELPQVCHCGGVGILPGRIFTYRVFCQYEWIWAALGRTVFLLFLENSQNCLHPTRDTVAAACTEINSSDKLNRNAQLSAQIRHWWRQK